MPRLLRRRWHAHKFALVTAPAVLLAAFQILPSQAAHAADPVISQGKPAVASSEGATNLAAKFAVDGNTSTRWASVEHVDPQWIQVDLGTTMNVSKVELVWDVSCAKGYQIQLSKDAKTFATAYSTTTGKGGTEDVALKATGRYVRMFGTVRCRDKGYSLQEFRVFGAPPPPSGDPLVSQGQPASASSSASSSSSAAKAVDGKSTTSWTSVSGIDPQWLQVDLGKAYRISRVKIAWDSACARDYEVQISEDAKTYTNAFLTTDGTGGTSDLPLQVSGRYVRIFGTGRCSSSAGYSIRELQVFGAAASTKLLSQGKSITAKSEASTSHAAAKAVDGDTATTWSSQSNADPQWIRVDLGQKYALAKTEIIWGSGGCASAYRIQVSDNDVDYSDEYNSTLGNGGTTDIYLNAAGRFVRLWLSSRCSNATHDSVAEFKVYGTTLPPTPSSGTVTVGHLNGTYLPSNYLGFSFGVVQLTDAALTSGNFTTYLKTLGTGVLRFGGDGDETLFWTSTNEPAPTWATVTLTPAALQRLNTLAVNSGWKVIVGANLQSGDTARVADEAKYAHQILGSHLLALELGNEPNYWAGYTPDEYYSAFEKFRAAIQKVAPGLPLLGPSVGRVSAGDDYLNTFANDEQEHGVDVSVLASHFYPACSTATSNGKIDIPNLLSTDWHNRERLRADLVASLAARLHVPGMITEGNSVSCAGRPGVSDVFASALWGVDELLSVAEAGDEGLDLHGELGMCGSPSYAPLCAATQQDAAANNVQAQPDFYAPLLVHTLGTGYLQPVTNSAPSVIRAYAIRSGTRVRLVVVNVSDPATSKAFPVSFNLSGTFTSGDYYRLTAPSLDAKTGITLGGHAMGTDGTFAAPTRTPLSVDGTTLKVSLPAGSATVITLNP